MVFMLWLLVEWLLVEQPCRRHRVQAVSAQQHLKHSTVCLCCVCLYVFVLLYTNQQPPTLNSGQETHCAR